MPEIDESQLIADCLRWDEKAWGILYAHYRALVFKVIATGGWSFQREEAEDLVQEVFLELIRSLPNFRKEAALSTFLIQLAKNKCVSTLRRKTALKRGAGEAAISLDMGRGGEEENPIPISSEEPTPEESSLHREEIESVRRALELIPTECQTLISLRFFDEKSYDEICQALGLPLGTICSRLKRCLTKLHSAYVEKFAQQYD